MYPLKSPEYRQEKSHLKTSKENFKIKKEIAREQCALKKINIEQQKK